MSKRYHNPKTRTREEVIRTLKLLEFRKLRRLYLAMSFNVLSSLFDLLAVAVVGAIAAILANADQGITSTRVRSLLRVMNLDALQLRQQIIILASVALVLFISRSIFSAIVSRKVIFFLSRESASITTNLLLRLMERQLTFITRASIQERLYAVTIGVNTVTLGILASLFALVSDFSLLVVLMIGLFIFDSSTALATLIIFCVVAYVLHKMTVERSKKFSLAYAQLTVRSQESIQNTLNLFREIRTRNSQKKFIDRISSERRELAFLQAEIRFLPLIGKYVFEVALVLVTLSVAWYQFNYVDKSRAVGSLALFLAASTRIAPAILRVQQSISTLKSSVGACDPTFKLHAELNSLADENVLKLGMPNLKANEFKPEVKMVKVSYTYPGANTPTLNKVSLELNQKGFHVITGRSGAGKSTLVDLILGLITSTEGEVTISGVSSPLVSRHFPGFLSYVPQETFLNKGTVRENLLLGLEPNNISVENIEFALIKSGLIEVVKRLPNGLDTLLGERGAGLSGGQKQRLGLARALVTRPKLLVLDEVTSSLDAQTENEILMQINSLKRKMTILLISHRKRALSFADQVIKVDKGTVVVESKAKK